MSGCKDDQKSGAAKDGGASEAKEKRAEPRLGFFSKTEALTVSAMLARFFPSDLEHGAPGADELDVLTMVDRELQKPHFAGLHRMVRAGISFLDRVAKRRYKRPFHRLDDRQRDAVISAFASGSISGLRFPQERFFLTMHSLALEGYWGPPRYGGNEGEGSWEWAGIEDTYGDLQNCCGGG